MFASSMSNATDMVIHDVTAALDLDGVSVAVDVGGSTGALVQELLKKSQGLTGVVLEMPHVVDSAVEAASKAGVLDRFSAVSGDFFKEVPAADLYLLKMIIHDWNDAECLTILRNCRASAKPGARAAVFDCVVGKTGEPNYGALLDMNMLVGSDGQERDFDEFDALYAKSGWRRVATKPTRSPQVIQVLEAI
ncbi:Mitomycin biosynthesis 6-O-methyltransferase [Streptomyces sp. RB17]|nr:Mitomycin biosynthesis 6-O-methyltransferase [Streptomyces sp. RB17]